MTVSILSLALAYVFLLFLVLLAVLKSELAVGLKFVLAGLCLGFYLWHYLALKQHLGWPASIQVPDRFELIDSYTVEPDLKNDEIGAVYLWLRDLDREGAPPRSIRLPYQRQLHRQVDDTLRKQRAGERFVGSPAPGGQEQRTQLEFEAARRDLKSDKSSLGQ